MKLNEINEKIQTRFGRVQKKEDGGYRIFHVLMSDVMHFAKKKMVSNETMVKIIEDWDCTMPQLMDQNIELKLYILRNIFPEKEDV